MKKYLLMAFFAVAAIGANAQNAIGQVTLKPMVGMTIANITDAEGTDSKIGLAAGVEAEFGVAEKFGITAGAIYSMQGAKESGSFDDYDAYGTAKLKLEYINIPILANYYIVPGLAIKAGIQPGFNVKSKIKVSSGGTSAEQDLDGIKTVDFSIPVGLSYEYQGFVFDARYNWGLTKIVDGSDSKNSVFMISLGYKFAL